MNSVEDTAQTMFATQTVKSVVQQASSIIVNKMIYGNREFKSNQSAIAIQQENVSKNVNELSSNIKFTGQFTDIAYADTGNITEKTISELCNDDQKLLNNVMDTYNNAVNDGLLKREWSRSENDIVYTLTDKGKELVNSESFIRQLEKNTQNSLYNQNFKNTALVELTGTKDDVNIFRYVDSLNVKAFDSSPTINNLFELLKKYNFITIDENGNAKATNKLFTYFEQQDKKGIKSNLKISKVTSDNLQQVAEAINKTSQVAKKSAEITAKTAKATATAGVSLAVDLSKKGLELLNKTSKALSNSSNTISHKK